MPDLPDPQDETGQPDQAKRAPAGVEIYTTERLQEFLAANTMTPDLRARADARLDREPRHDREPVTLTHRRPRGRSGAPR